MFHHMSDDNPQNKPETPVTHEVEMKATATGVAGLDAVLITLEEHLGPIFSKMDMARLYRISQGDKVSVPGVDIGSQKAVQLIAQYWYEKRRSLWLQVRNAFLAVIATLAAGALLALLNVLFG